MMKQPRLKLALALPLAVALLLPVAALRAQEEAPKTINLKSFNYQEQDVVIPVASEVFRALDKLGDFNWNGVLAGTSFKYPSNQAGISMLLGTVIADGFIAVEAKDSRKVDDIGRQVIKLATSLGVGESVKSHCNAITEAAKGDHWNDVRTELDKAQNSVRDAMKKLRSQDESELISIAGWLRGTDALTSLVKANYTADRADLLHQQDMLTTFDKQLNGMTPTVKNNPVVTQLRTGLQKIKPMIEAHANDAIPQKTVVEINDITASLVKTIAPQS